MTASCRYLVNDGATDGSSTLGPRRRREEVAAGAPNLADALARGRGRLHAHRVDGRRHDLGDPDRDGSADVPRGAGEVPGPRRPDRICGTWSCRRGSSTRTTPRSLQPTIPERARHDHPRDVLRANRSAHRSRRTPWLPPAPAATAPGRSAWHSTATQFSAARMSASSTCFVILDGTTGTRYGTTATAANCTATWAARRTRPRHLRPPPAGSHLLVIYPFLGITWPETGRRPQAATREPPKP